MPRSAEANYLDRAVGWISPERGLRRLQARQAFRVLASHYDAAGTSRRTHGWKRPTGGPNAATPVTLSRLRDAARHLVRNSGFAESALQVISDDTVGWGIAPLEKHAEFEAWSSSLEIDADGRCDLPGLQELVMRTVAESGECLVRRRWRRPADGLSLPMQIQVLEPDYLDSSQHRTLKNGRGKIVRGIEFGPYGRRVAYHMFREHPAGASGLAYQKSVRVPASEICHVYPTKRAGQVRGASWFAPVLIRFNDFDELADATLVKSKIAACLAVLTTDVDGSNAPLGTEDQDNETYDTLEPGWIGNLPPGRDITVVQPPSVREYPDFAKTTLREIAAGLGVTVEDLTGDYSNLPFSAARMSRIRHWARVSGWRWRMLVPQFLDPLWAWAMQAAALSGLEVIESTYWTAPPLPMIEPDKEGLAILRNIRTGITTLPEELRRRGYKVSDFLDEYAESQAELDRRGIVLDSDPRIMTQAGQRHATPSEAPPASAPSSASRAFGEDLEKLIAGFVAAELEAAGNGGGRR